MAINSSGNSLMYTDLWWAARQSHPVYDINTGLGRGSMRAINLLPSDRAIIPDLNKYRPGADLKRLKEECGVNHVILRMGGPLQFIYDDWKLTLDPTYYNYYRQARALGMTIGAYIVYSAGIDDQDYANSESLIDFINQCMQGNQYKPDYLIVDDEVNTWWQNGKQVTATGVNQVKGLQYLFPKIWRYFKLVPMEYSARWFMDKYKENYTILFDNMNKGEKTVLNWFAFYPSVIQNSTTVYNTTDQFLADVPDFSLAQINSYLTIGSYSPYDLHQICSTWKTPFVKDSAGNMVGIDVSVTRLSHTLFLQALNLNNVFDTTPPAVPAGLSASAVNSNFVQLSWIANATDTAGYTIYTNGAQSGGTNLNNYTLNGLQPNTTYSITLDAFDAAGNHSKPSAPITVTTTAASKGCSPSSGLLNLFVK